MAVSQKSTEDIPLTPDRNYPATPARAQHAVPLRDSEKANRDTETILIYIQDDYRDSRFEL